MKILLSEKQLKFLKAFLFLKEDKKQKLKDSEIKKGVELKSVEALGSTKKEEKTEKKEPMLDKSKLKITSIKELEKVLEVIAHHNKGLKIPTKVKSKFSKEIKFASEISRDLRTKLERLIKTTSGVDHNVNQGSKNVFISTKNKTDKTGKLKPSSFKAELKKVLKVKSLELPLTDVEIPTNIANDFLTDVAQNYSSNFVLKAEGGKIFLTYGK